MQLPVIWLTEYGVVLPKDTSNFYHVLNNSANRCEDQTINPEYFGESLITCTDDVLEK